ncbi:hypothetical protein O2N63_01835 [Aliiroseovarius sp. KMU-50]|uniref:HEAT repeat domain-containing protein n=1 Tax=Aliiroseovarius salicola TaxID=3009082 RepID=A0ABT4VZ57_9RHOB|nr:hypothetical protein [Aliiroseovarius sp. KMU-50]MDA5092823.1 hypothetical protein [Aliiroseovarius sp. KMU-50]
MMRWLAGIVLIILTAGKVHADTIAVRSGEHQNFSRLVVYTHSPGAWKFGRVDGGFELRLASPDVQFNLERAFELIPRTRISDLGDLGDGRLQVSATCDCHADVFVVGGGQIVIDIVSGEGSSANEIYNAYLDKPRQPNFKLRSEADARVTTAARLGLPLFPSKTQERLNGAETPSAPYDINLDEPVARDDERAGQDSRSPTNHSRVQSTELALLEQIGRAAAQGLIDADMSSLEAEVEKSAYPQGAIPEPIAEEIDAPVLPKSLDVNEHIAVQTSIDRETSTRQAVVLSTQEGFACFSDGDYSIELWGQDISNGADLAQYKSALLGEFDRPDPDAINQYIRYLIYLTFGAETRAVASQFKDAITSHDIVMQMADVMDFHQSTQASDVAPQMGCDGKTALWAALSQPELRPGQEINTKAILTAFSELPLHLRRHLGPKLAQKFMDHGDQSSAMSIRNYLERASGDHGVGFELLEARIDLQEGDADQAEERLTRIVNDDGELSPDAALELVNSKLERGEPVPQRYIELVSTYSFERRGGPEGAVLMIAEIRALASVSNFDEAYEQIDLAASSRRLVSWEITELRSHLLAELLAKGGDAQFLRYTIGHIEDAVGLEPRLRTDLARRLLSLGFSRQARMALDVEGVPPGVPQRLTYAMIALYEDKPKTALGYLAGIETEGAERLRAEALMAAGNPDAAAEIYHNFNEVDARQRAILRSKSWQNLAQSELKMTDELDRLQIVNAEPIPDVDESTLAQSTELLKRSEVSRSILSSFLAKQASAE